MTKLDIEYLLASTLRAYPRNARTHSKKQIKQIANSIRQFGFTNPLLIDDHNMILAGHGRLAAARTLDMGEFPCVRLSHMTPAQKKAYASLNNDQLDIARAERTDISASAHVDQHWDASALPI